MKLFVLLLLTATLSACQTAPKDPNRLPLETTQGVKDLFADSTVTQEQAEEQIHCKRQTDTGTRISKRVCWTVGEGRAAQQPLLIRRFEQLDPALRATN
ncbi:MAG: hypothetical protein AB8B96_00085 [Lysobacterales bacterium]